MGMDSLEQYLSREEHMQLCDLLVGASVHFENGIEFVHAHLWHKGETPKTIREVDLHMSLVDFERRFADSDVLLTWQGRGVLERAMSVIESA